MAKDKKRGIAADMEHKAKRVAKKTKETTPPLEVEDHGNGYMIIGTNRILEARAELGEYVDNPGDYKFACPNSYNGRSAVWLTTGPGEVWDGATDPMGEPLPR